MNTYVVLMPSAISDRLCLLGEGPTADAAMSDAYGPKPWPKSSKRAIVRLVTEEELDDFKTARANA
jgi:hypothetical protein